MKKLLIWLALLATTGPAFSYYYDGNRLVAECNDTQLVGKALCLGLILGAYDAIEANVEGQVCMPEGVTKGQLESLVLKWLNDHPERLHESMGVLITEALREKFTCRR